MQKLECVLTLDTLRFFGNLVVLGNDLSAHGAWHNRRTGKCHSLLEAKRLRSGTVAMKNGRVHRLLGRYGRSMARVRKSELTSN